MSRTAPLRPTGAARSAAARAMSPRALAGVALSLAVIVAAAATAGLPGAARAQAEAPAEARATVRTERFDAASRPALGSAAARVLSPNDATLAAETTARIHRVHADAGSAVAAGTLLLELDATDARLALAQAEAQLAAARAQATLARQRAERGERLREGQFIAEDERLALATGRAAAEADVQVAEAARRVAARGVEKTRVLAPFDGVVTERFAQVGALAAPGTPLLRIVDTAAPELEAQLAPDDALALETASELRFVGADGRAWPLRLLRRAPVVDPGARTMLVRLGFTGAAPPAGSSGQLAWAAAQRELPATLAVRRGDALGVFIDDGGRARFVAVPDGREGRALRLSLPADARVVVQGQQGLADGDALPARDATGAVE